MAKVYAIILAGGKGLRLNRETPKQFLPLGGRPVIAWSIRTCDSIEEIDHILVVIPNEFIPRAEEIVAKHGIRKVTGILPGGETRQESARNALQSRPFDDSDILLFHDAARPFIKTGIIQNCIGAVRRYGAAAVYVPVQDTITEIQEGFAVSVPPRERLYAAQTPQAFLYSVINKAHVHAAGTGFTATDDVSLALNAGFKARMVGGDNMNFKITTDADYRNACMVAENIK